MDAKTLNKILVKNTDIIIDILKDIGVRNIPTVTDNRIQFGFSGNSRSHCIYLDDNLTHHHFSANIIEGFINFIARIKKITFTQSVNLLTSIVFSQVTDLGVRCSDEDDKKDIEQIIYSEDILNTYEKIISGLFLEDGICPTVQSKFGIRFSERYSRIIFPVRQNGKLVGILGRYNMKEVPSNTAKYLPILHYYKSKVIFGLDENIDYIKQNNNECIIVESEKSVMRAMTLGYNNVLAIGGNCIKNAQVDILKSNNIVKINLCLDKGLPLGHVDLLKIRMEDFGFQVNIINNEIDEISEKECVFDLKDRVMIDRIIRGEING